MTETAAAVGAEQQFLPTFSPTFLEDHAGRLVTDPKIALLEIVANAWDAGSDTVRISWPRESVPETIAVEDNGTGMTKDEFLHRWLELNYNRGSAQGDIVLFPSDNKTSHRRAFGRNGKGRHSMFCFADTYHVETWRDGNASSFTVARHAISAPTPFMIDVGKSTRRDGHGTRVWAKLGRNYLPTTQVRDLIGSRFISDPSFEIFINDEQIQLTSLDHLIDVEKIEVEGVGEITVSLIDTARTSRTSHPHGIAWWVNNRLVGEISWTDFKDTYELDRRTIEAKRFTFVVEADVLVDEVLDDWSGFKDSDLYKSVRHAIEENIRERILESLKDIHKARKRAALESHAEKISSLTSDSRYIIGQVVDGIQERIPSVQEKVLSATIEVIARLEEARTGYRLLEQLAELGPDELDKLSEILDRWSVHEARVVLGELERRLKIIEKLELLVDDPSSDELQDIQPLFERGLWIFGPEYESIHFTSNQTLLTVIRDLLKDEIPEDLRRRRRPDFVALPDSTVGVYASNSFDANSEVSGFEKVLIVELKRGGYKVALEERRQGEDYARELRKSGKVQNPTSIVVLVLGAEVASEVMDPLTEGNTTVLTRPYGVVIQQAHARTFFLLEKIREAKKNLLFDADVEEVIGTPIQRELM